MTVYVLPRWVKPAIPAFDVTSRGSDFRFLSPMVLGPVGLYGHMASTNVENAWQYSKVYPKYSTPETYWPWAKAGWASTWANRYPMGKGAKPLHSLWDGLHLDYIEARQRIYIPLYRAAVRQHAEPTFNLLKSYASQGDIALLDFDAYDHRSLGYSWDDVINDPSRKMGHAFVLAMMLEGVI